MSVHGGNGIVSGAVVFVRDPRHNLLYVQFIKGHVLLSHATFFFLSFTCFYFQRRKFVLFQSVSEKSQAGYFSVQKNDMTTRGERK